MEYIEIINNIERDLNDNSRGRASKGKNERIFTNLRLLKSEYNTELSTFYLRNLVKGNSIQKSKKITALIKNRQKRKDGFCYWYKSTSKSQKEVKIFGLNKWGEPVLKNLYYIDVLKDYLGNRNKNFKFFSLD